MREIKFRGKRTDGDGWVFGSFRHYRFLGKAYSSPCITVSASPYILNCLPKLKVYEEMV